MIDFDSEALATVLTIFAVCKGRVMYGLPKNIKLYSHIFNTKNNIPFIILTSGLFLQYS